MLVIVTVYSCFYSPLTSSASLTPGPFHCNGGELCLCAASQECNREQFCPEGVA